MNRAIRLDALAWLMGSALAWAAVSVIVRTIDGRVHANDLSFLRACVTVVFTAPLVLSYGAAAALRVPRGAALGFFAARAAMLFVAQATYYYALTHMNLADAVVINMTSPVFVALIAPLFLGERMDGRKWTAIAIGFAGVVIVVRPGLTAFDWAVAAALGSALLFAGTGLTNKFLSRTEPASRVVFFTNALVAVFGLGPFLIGGNVPAWSDMPLVAAFCVVGAGAQYCFARAVDLADATALAPFEFVRVPVAALAGWLFFLQTPGLWTWAGTAVIFFGVYLLTRRTKAPPGAVRGG